MNKDLLNKFTDQYMSAEGKWFPLQWHYITACIMKGYMDVHSATGEQKYLDFAENYLLRLFDKQGTAKGVKPEQYNIDQIRMAKTVLDMHELRPRDQYIKVADIFYKQFADYPRTKEGNFWHKEFYYNQVWLDGLYMGQPFYAHYLKKFYPGRDFSDTIRQFETCRQRIWDDSLKLYKHAWDEARKMDWADKETGRSPCVWLRAVGWYAMALVDVMEIIGKDDPGYGILKVQLAEMISGLKPYQHESGMWYQVVDQGDRENNYLESSGTLMIAYALMKGSRLGMLPEPAAADGLKILDGTVKTCLREESGEVLLGNICRSAGLGKHPDAGYMRDGTYEYYTTGENIVNNNGHGTAPLLMAWAEVLKGGLA